MKNPKCTLASVASYILTGAHTKSSVERTVSHKQTRG